MNKGSGQIHGCIESVYSSQGFVIDRSSCPEMFCRKSVPKNFAKTYRKTRVLDYPFNKLAGLQPAPLSKEDLGTCVFL